MVQKKPVPPKQAQARRPKKSGFFKRFILFPLLFLLGVGLLGGLGLVAGYLYINEDLPKINSLMDYRPAIISKVFADDGRVIAEFFKERRIVVPLSEVSPTLVNAFVAAEDSRFFKHQGFDLVSIVRAFIKNLEAGDHQAGRQHHHPAGDALLPADARAQLHPQDQGAHFILSDRKGLQQGGNPFSLPEPDLPRPRGLRG